LLSGSGRTTGKTLMLSPGRRRVKRAAVSTIRGDLEQEIRRPGGFSGPMDET
jgi:hypothetical protein